MNSRDQGRQVEDDRTPNALADCDDADSVAVLGGGKRSVVRVATHRQRLRGQPGPDSQAEYIAPHFSNYGLPEWVAQPPLVSVVIPARNEEKCLPYVLSRIPAWVHEVVLVDGASADATIEVARHHWPSIRIVRQISKGKGGALREGFSHSTGDLIVAIDADGSMDPGEMGVFVALLDLGFDYVKGSRMLPGGGSHDLTTFRRLGNWVFRTLTNLIHRSRYTDLCYGYFAFRRGTVDALPLRTDGFAIETEINVKAWKAGFRVMEVPSRESDRIEGSSGLRPFGDGWRILSAIFRERFSGSAQYRPNADIRLLQPSPVVIDRNESGE